MIDWHSHILPGMDDGSRSVEESISMLFALAAQGVTRVVATPHFYADDESPNSFLKRRERSWELLRAALPDGGIPQISLGAEVSYYPGIGRLNGLKELRVQGGRVLLLEMPFNGWTDSMARELQELSGSGTVHPVLAHIDRYNELYDRRLIEKLTDCGVLLQADADGFFSHRPKRRVMELLRSGEIRFIGSDCHNMTSRPPDIGRLFALIQKKLGDSFIKQMNEYGSSVLVYK